MIEYSTPDEILRAYVREHARRCSAKGIDHGKPIVDGGESGISEDRWTQLTLLVRGVPELAIDATRVMVFALTGYTSEPVESDYPSREAYLTAVAAYPGPQARGPTELQAAKALRVPVAQVRGALSVARKAVNVRLQAMLEGRE